MAVIRNGQRFRPLGHPGPLPKLKLVGNDLPLRPWLEIRRQPPNAISDAVLAVSNAAAFASTGAAADKSNGISARKGNIPLVFFICDTSDFDNFNVTQVLFCMTALGRSACIWSSHGTFPVTFAGVNFRVTPQLILLPMFTL
ncbi:hypothetical protein CHS0354_037630 [Potamilus streckersoni]|uniref:Uncharacterized protein n=1 Tax=Potamilus streckersoni TaxID=2493646 RepID=A0AAE0T571_9BIVA|nr:hypothetical protein CHS0354_037630 [Potamilus streckersoni]